MTYLIVPLHNDQERLRKFVACLNAQTVKPFVLWVDNGAKECARCVVRSYRGGCRCLPITRSGYSRNYWTGCLKTAQEWVTANASADDVVGVMNNDVTFEPTYIEKAVKDCGPRRIVTSLIVDMATNRPVQRGVKILWSRIFTRKYGAISTVSRFTPPFDAMRDSGVFVTAETFRNVKLHPYLLPHYCNDYVWTNRLIRNGFKVLAPVALWLDFSTTGIINPKSLRELFSVRCPHNPIIYTVFILLVCPLLWKLPNIVRVWGYAVVRAWRILTTNTLEKQ